MTRASWRVPLTRAGLRARSCSVAHHIARRRVACGRSARRARFAGYRSEPIARWVPAAGIDRRCKLCARALERSGRSGRRRSGRRR